MFQIVKSALDLLGAFTLMATLLFDSSALGIFITGEIRFESTAFLLSGIVLAMAVAEIVFMIIDRVAPSIGKVVTAICSFLLPLIAFGLTLGIIALSPASGVMSSIVVVLLCIAAICQFHCFTRRSNLDACSLFLASALSLIAAILLVYIAFFVLDSPISGFIFLSFIMAVTGVLACINVLSSLSTGESEDIPSIESAASLSESSSGKKEAYTDGESEESQRKRDIVVLALPLLIVSLFCTFALGQDQQEHLFNIFDQYLLALLAIILVFIALTFLIYWLWKRSMNINTFLCGLTIPLALPIFVTVLENMQIDLMIASALMLTQIFYLLFSWTSVLLIGRMISMGNSLTPGFIVLFLMFYTVFMSLPQFEDVAIASRFISLASLGLLISLLLFFGHKASKPITVLEKAEPEMGLALQRKCEEAAKLYGLSPRESELLPMLAIGLSASAIGNRIVLSDHTVKTHRYRIYQKIGINSHEELVEKLDLVSLSNRS